MSGRRGFINFNMEKENMADISLTASMRSNLLSLQNTQSLMDLTQERLSTGKKVNSAIDNPSSYYTAQSLTNRANDLNALLDSMGQGIQTIKAANEGIEAITAFVEQAKGVANSALDTSKGEDRAKYQEQFNNILKQIDSLAKDSGYKGINLLNGDSLTVTFNEDRSSKLEIEGKYADSKSLNITALTEEEDSTWNAAADGITTAEDALTAKQDEITAKKAEVTAQEEVVAEKQEAYDTAKAAYDAAVAPGGGGDAGNTLKDAMDAAKTALDGEVDKLTPLQTALSGLEDEVPALEEAVTTAEKAAVTASRDNINKSVTEVENAINNLRTMASDLGNNYSIVQNREDFTESLVNVLTEGSDKLTLADMNEESANMLALQTRQQLAINSLSLASQAAQSVLKLF